MGLSCIAGWDVKWYRHFRKQVEKSSKFKYRGYIHTYICICVCVYTYNYIYIAIWHCVHTQHIEVLALNIESWEIIPNIHAKPCTQTFIADYSQ